MKRREISYSMAIVIASIMFIILSACGRSEKRKGGKSIGNARRIDVHHHIVPTGYLKKIRSVGINESLGVSWPEWTPEKSLRFMDDNKIDYAIASITSPGVYFKNDEFSRKLARWCNEYMAELKRKYPNRFGGFASLPLPYVKGSLDELKYSLDVLKLDGVVLMTHYKGAYIGNKKFDKLYKELNRRGTVVFIHPTDPPYKQGMPIPSAIIEAPFETTRVATYWLYSGNAEKYPKIRFILSHGGGTVPYLANRIALAAYLKENNKPKIVRSLYDFVIKGKPVTGLKLLKGMYYDTAITYSPAALGALKKFAGTKRIVYGSDFVQNQNLAPLYLKHLLKYKGFTKDDFADLEYRNVHRLFGHSDRKKTASTD